MNSARPGSEPAVWSGSQKPNNNTPEIRLIVTDLDSTLLHEDKTISAYTAEVFHKCTGQGILTAFATARFITGCLDYMEQVRPDYALLNDGTMLYHRGSFLSGLPLSPDAANALIIRLKQYDPAIRLTAASDEQIYRNYIPEADLMKRPPGLLTDFSEPFLYPVYKIVAEPSDGNLNGHSDFFRSLADEFDCQTFQYRGENRHSLLNKKAGKFPALQMLADQLGIPLSQVAAFGDDRNDLEMVQKCGLGIAVANAIPELKEVADDFTLSNEEDGVAHYIDKNLLTRP